MDFQCLTVSLLALCWGHFGCHLGVLWQGPPGGTQASPAISCAATPSCHLGSAHCVIESSWCRIAHCVSRTRTPCSTCPVKGQSQDYQYHQDTMLQILHTLFSEPFLLLYRDFSVSIMLVQSTDDLDEKRSWVWWCICNPRTWETEALASKSRVWSQPRLHSKTLSQNVRERISRKAEVEKRGKHGY
jgi:hypothetical protein